LPREGRGTCFARECTSLSVLRDIRKVKQVPCPFWAIIKSQANPRVQAGATLCEICTVCGDSKYLLRINRYIYSNAFAQAISLAITKNCSLKLMIWQLIVLFARWHCRKLTSETVTTPFNCKQYCSCEQL